MRHRMIVCVAALFALSSGCSREAVKPVGTNEMTHGTVSNTPPYQATYELMAAKLKTGMTKDEVRKALGDPTETKGVYGGGNNYGLWLYRIEKSIFLRIRFDNDDKVSSWSLEANMILE